MPRCRQTSSSDTMTSDTNSACARYIRPMPRFFSPQDAEVKQSLQPAGQILCAAANQGDDLVGTQKPVPVDEPENVVVTCRQPYARNRGHALESGKAGH